MRKIFCIGETVYDIIFKNGQPVAAKAGGSMLNACVTMGRTGLPAHFISEYAKDQIGNEIDNFLTSSHINTKYVYRYSDGKTSIAIAFLNEKNDANYTFYKQLPEKRLNIEWPVVNKHDIVQLGSFYAINPEIRPLVKQFAAKANEVGAIVYYDPNYRKAHLHELELLKPMIIENMQMATIVRGSDEDFQMIFNASNLEEAWAQVKKYCNTLIYTEASKSVTLKTDQLTIEVPSKKIHPISTIGAGDNFNAGIIYGIYKVNIEKEKIAFLKKEQWEKIIHFGIEFASEVCLSYENYIGESFARNYKI